MPGTNLTRDEAEARAGHLAVDSYAVEIDLTEGGATFGSTTTVSFTSSVPSMPTWLDLIAPQVLEVTVNGLPLDPATCYDGARVSLTGLAEHNEVRVVARCAYMTTGEGLHRFVDPVDQRTYLYSQFEVPDSRRVFAVFEQPDLKARFSFTVDAPAEWEVVSNSAATSREPVGDAAHRWTFAPTPPISSYVTALCAGPFHVERSEYVAGDRVVPLGLFCRQSISEHLDHEHLFDVTRRGFAFFEQLFDYPYPFDKYDQLFVPEFNAGAMENVGCVTYRDEYLFRSRVTDAAYERRAETVLHEMAHMWFGDLVTMRWWNDLWLNESFATWASVLCQSEATQWDEAWSTFASAEKLWALRQDQLPTTHPVSAEINDLHDVQINFDGITYAKGAAVLKQLVAWVGRDAFVAGLRRYFQTHAYGNTTLADLFVELEAESGRDLGSWEQEWLLSAGVNVLRPVYEIEHSADGPVYAQAAVLQGAPDDHPVLRSHRLVVGLYDCGHDGLVRREKVEVDITGERTELPALAGKPLADLILVNDDDLTYAKIRFDDRSLDTLSDHIDELDSSLARALAWTGLTDMLRDAQLPATRYVGLVLAGVACESDISVVQTLLMQGRAAVEQYSDPGARVGLRARWASGLHNLARRADPGTDQQLAFVRAWATAAGSPDDLTQVRDLLTGASVLDGLTVDRDLRWHLLQRLVVHGAAGDAEIDAELARDDTATGRLQAAWARAARPSLPAKQQAWDAIVTRDQLTNAEAEAMLASFGLPEHRELVRAFVQPYFDGVADMWAGRTFATAERIIEGLFPRVVVEQATVDLALDRAADSDLPRPVRRMMREGAADVARALRGQAADAAAG
jgi:aminopeptidase N